MPDSAIEDLAQKTITTIDRALKSGQVTSMPELVRIIRALSSDEGRVSLSELADLINQDQTVLMRVVAAANTFGYNPSGMEITSVTGAIHAIGFTRVRTLAMSLLLHDHAELTVSPAEQRQMANISLCSGMIAQITAESSPLISPELAFVCASLRNFGRLLLGTFMTDNFRAANAAAAAGEGDEAYRKAFGLTPFELGYELLKSSNLPPVILNAVRQHEVPPSEDSSWSEVSLHRLAGFSLELSEISLNVNLTRDEFLAAQQDIAGRAAKDFPFFANNIAEILAASADRLGQLVGSHRSTARSSGPSLHRLRERAQILRQAADPTFQRASQATTAEDTAEPAQAIPDEPTIIEPLADPEPDQTMEASAPRRGSGMADLFSRLESCDNADDALTLALDAVWNALKPSELIFAKIDGRRRNFRVARGSGPLAKLMAHKTLFSIDERNAFTLCHERLINLAVQTTDEERIRNHLPDWIKTPTAPKSFLALPVHHQKALLGVLILGWAEPRTKPFANKELSPIQSLFELVAKHAAHPKKRAA